MEGASMKRRKGIKAFSLFMALVLIFTTGIWSQALETEAVFEEPDVLTDNMEEAPEESGAGDGAELRDKIFSWDNATVYVCFDGSFPECRYIKRSFVWQRNASRWKHSCRGA